MPILKIGDISDPRIAPFRELRDKNLAARENLFIAEGEHLVRRLLESDFETHAVLVQDSRLHAFAQRNETIYVAPADLIEQIVGFKFHRGVLALGIRRPLLSIDQLLVNAKKNDRLLILPEINDVENLGGLLRTAAALGFGDILLGPSCCDAFARRAIRTSAGSVFKLNLAQSTDLIHDLARLKNEHGYKLYGATTGASPSLPGTASRLGLLFGTEADGLSKESVNHPP